MNLDGALVCKTGLKNNCYIGAYDFKIESKS